MMCDLQEKTEDSHFKSPERSTMSLLILLITSTCVLSASARGCSIGAPSSAHITVYADIFTYLKHLGDFQILRKFTEAFNGSSNQIKIELHSYDTKMLGKYIRENHPNEADQYSLAEDYIIKYINSMEWKPPITDKRTSHVLILLLKSVSPHIFMQPKIHALKRAGFHIFTLVYESQREHVLEEVATYPAEWHSYVRSNFHHSDDAAEALVRSACRNIEAKESRAKKELVSELRLVGGDGGCQGRVELLYNDTWSLLSDERWDRRAADVICRQVKCGPSLEALKGDTFGAGGGHVLHKLDCTGDEDDVSQCLLGEWSERRGEGSAGVTCLPSGVSGVRLVNGSGPCDGTVELSVDHEWRRVSLWNFDLREAALVCRQMGCGPLLRIHEVIPTTSHPGIVQRSRCFGSETTFSECRIGLWGAEEPEVDVHAAVTCAETGLSGVSLAEQSGQCSGKVRVLSGGLWSSVCAMEWSAREEAVLCRQMGCGPASELHEVKKMALSRAKTPQTLFRNIHCSGSEAHLSQCSAVMSSGYQCYSEEARTSCTQAEVMGVRLVDGPHSCSGRVEVLFKKSWGTVCDQHWDLSDAQVVCRQAGCGPAVEAPGGAYFGPGTGTIWLEKVFCNGTEPALSQCGATVAKKPLCVHSQDASVICKEKSWE